MTHKFFFIFLVSCIPFNADAFSSSLILHFFDVGEGDAIHIQSHDHENIVIDSGNLITGYKVLQFLKKEQISLLNHVIFTHADGDHIGGAFMILQELSVSHVYDNGYPLAQNDLNHWYEKLVRSHPNYLVLQKGDSLPLQNLHFEIIWPMRPFLFKGNNTNSIVILIKFEAFKILLCGDLVEPAEKELLSRNLLSPVDIIKIGHHGSSYATSKIFLDTIKPKTAIISINNSNRNGYPATETINRLKDKNVQIYRTDIHGTISLILNENRIKVLTEK